MALPSWSGLRPPDPGADARDRFMGLDNGSARTVAIVEGTEIVENRALHDYAAIISPG
jgi:hypothetical protein